MLSRCPSCGVALDDELTTCPSCSWDFQEFRKVRRPGASAAVGPAAHSVPGAASPETASAALLRRPAAPAAPVEQPSLQMPKLPTIPQRPLPPPPPKPPPTAPSPLTPRRPPAPPQSRPPLGATPAAVPPKDPLRRGPRPAPVPEKAPPPGLSRLRFPLTRTQDLVMMSVLLCFLSMIMTYFFLKPELPPSAREMLSRPMAEGEEDQRIDLEPEDLPPPAPGSVPALPAASTSPLTGAAPAAVPEPAASAPASPQAAVAQPERKPEPPIAPQPPAPAAPPVKDTAPASPPAAPPARPPAQAPPRREPRPAPGSWAFQGVVYDIVSLFPVFGADIIFKDPSGKVRAEVSTGKGGAYRVELASLQGGYRVSIRHADYRPGYLEDLSPPLREVERAQRLFLSRSVAANRPWVGSQDRTTRKDMVLIPKVLPER